MMFGRFNLYVRSYTSIFNRAFDTKRARGHGWAWGLEVLGVACFWVWFSQVLIGCGTWQKALMYVLVSHAATSPLHITVRFHIWFDTIRVDSCQDCTLAFLHVDRGPWPCGIMASPSNANDDRHLLS